MILKLFVFMIIASIILCGFYFTGITLFGIDSSYNGDLKAGTLIRESVIYDCWGRTSGGDLLFNGEDIGSVPCYGLPPTKGNDCGWSLNHNILEEHIEYKAYLKSYGLFGLSKSIFIECTPMPIEKEWILK